MNLFFVFLVWLASWIAIIAIHAAGTISAKSDTSVNVECWPFASQEIVADGNNLFVTGFFYCIGNVVCHFFPIKIVSILMLVIGVAACIPPLFSLFSGIIPQMFQWKNKYMTYMTLSAALQTFVPLILACNIYFRYIA